MKQNILQRLTLIGLLCGLASCASYKQNIMFKTEGSAILKEAAKQAQQNYLIQKNDYLRLEVYTSNGERIIDPDLKLLKDLPVQNNLSRPVHNYLVDVGGLVKFPMIGTLNIEGLTIRMAEDILQTEYAKYYKDPFVKLEYTNKRVVVLGAPGGKVIPLLNENTTLIEILALSNGIDNNAKAQNIRVLRGEEFFVADLTTIEGYQKSIMTMQHGDIIYVEPVRRPVSEAARDYAPLLSLGISIMTLMVVLIGL